MIGGRTAYRVCVSSDRTWARRNDDPLVIMGEVSEGVSQKVVPRLALRVMRFNPFKDDSPRNLVFAPVMRRGAYCAEERYDRTSYLQLHRAPAWQPPWPGLRSAGHHGERLVRRLCIHYVEREAGQAGA